MQLLKAFIVLNAILFAAAVIPLKFENLKTSIGLTINQAVGIDYSQFLGRLIVSYHYPTGAGGNFASINPFTLEEEPFSSIAGLTDEIKIAMARDGNLGGWPTGTFATGNGINGQVLIVAPDGASTNTIVLQDGSISGTGLMRGSLFFDRGGAFGGDLLVVTTSGQAWRIHRNGPGSFTSTFLFNANVHLEGLVTFPNDPLKWGVLSGKLMAGDEGAGRAWVYDPVTTSVAVYNCRDQNNGRVNIEDLDFVENLFGFFGVDYQEQTLIKVASDQWVPYVGELVAAVEVTTGTNNYGGTNSYLYLYRGASGTTLTFEAITIGAGSNYQYRQWEHVTFAAENVVSGCPTQWTATFDNKQYSVQGFDVPDKTIVEYYSYGTPHGSSSNSGLEVNNLGKTLVIFVRDSSKRNFFVVVHDKWDNNHGGGAAETDVRHAGDLSAATFVVQDDPNEGLSSGVGFFHTDHHWQPCCTDGYALGPIPDGACFNFTLEDTLHIEKLRFASSAYPDGTAFEVPKSDNQHLTITFCNTAQCGAAICEGGQRTEWQFNGFFCDHVTASSGDTGGSLAVRHDGTFNSFGVNTAYDCVTPPTLGLAVGGNILSTQWVGVKGDVFYGISASSNIGQNCNPPYRTRKDSDLDDLFKPYCDGSSCQSTYLGQYSAALAAHPTTGHVTVSFGTNMLLVPDAPGDQYFVLHSSDFTGITQVDLDTSMLDSNDVIYITVKGSGVVHSGGGNLYSGGFSFASRILWNYPEATTVTVNTGLQGSMIAPCASLTTGGGGFVDGKVFAKSWDSQGNLELHKLNIDCGVFQFVGPTLPSNPPQPVPDPDPSPSPSVTPSPSPVQQNCAPVYGQCGGIGWAGPTCCQPGSTCTVSNPYYSQCLPAPSKSDSGSTVVSTSVGVTVSAVVAVLFLVGGAAAIVFYRKRRSSISNPALPEDRTVVDVNQIDK